MTVRERFSLPAPAKINLGLEILGKRSDGYHDLATIFLAVSLTDTLEFATAQTLQVDCSCPDLAGARNLVLDALQAARSLAHTSNGARITLRKRIPLASGLGGASSDAATTLIGCQRLWQTTFSLEQLRAAAIGLGSDVPFFLRGGCALGTGRGEVLKHIHPPRDTWFILVTPDISIQEKTPSLFRDLQSGDFSDGELVYQQVHMLKSVGKVNPSLLVNAFARPLYQRAPEVKAMLEVMNSAGATNIALSGAGPTHYSVEDDPERASYIADRLRDQLGAKAQVNVAHALQPRPWSDLTTGPRPTDGAPR